MKKQFSLLVLSALLLSCGSAGAWAASASTSASASDQPVARPAHLSAADKVDVARIQDYLNKLKNVSAQFLQVNDDGAMITGTLAIQRPGKMRVVYDEPSKDFIVADGSAVHIWDNQLQAQTNVEQGSSLAEFILRDPVRLQGDVTITRFQRFPHKIELTLVQSDDPANGSLTLVFEDKPLMLRQWKVLDGQGRTTGVNLQNMREDVTFPVSTFDFVPPNFGKGGKAQ